MKRRRIVPSTRLLVLLAILVVIARSHVTVLPGWTIPLPALLLFGEVLAVGALVTWLLIRHLARRPIIRVSSGAGS